MEGTHIAISLPNVRLMSFIEVFLDTNQCKNHIITKDRNEITLFVYEDNMEWLIMNSYFKDLPQVRKINIFCSTFEKKQRWSRWTERFRRTIEEPFVFEELDFKLLLSGSKHIDRVRQQFPVDDAVSNRLKDDERNIWRVLGQYFIKKANTDNERDRKSEETQS
jgi:hypothetical protein